MIACTSLQQLKTSPADTRGALNLQFVSVRSYPVRSYLRYRCGKSCHYYSLSRTPVWFLRWWCHLADRHLLLAQPPEIFRSRRSERRLTAVVRPGLRDGILASTPPKKLQHLPFSVQYLSSVKGGRRKRQWTLGPTAVIYPRSTIRW